MLKMYKTVYKRAQAEISEKKSRFIANVKPVKNEEEARQFIDEIRKEHWNATHNVFAYQIGERNEIQRYSDDGEPSGTAGMPVLDILKGEDIKNVVVVVTRYFGGTLLGTGGLVRAYGKSAKEGILEADIIEKYLFKKLSLTIPYTLSGKVQYETLQLNKIIYDTVYTDKVEYVVLVEIDHVESYIKKIQEVTNGNTEIMDLGEIYGYYIDKELVLTEV